MTSKQKVGKVGSKNKEDAPYELESQFILRLPLEYASTVRRIAQSSSMNIKDRLTIELHPDGRHGIVRVDRVPLACKLVDLPCMIESMKTVDKKTFYKTADVSQMLVCTLDGDLYPPLEEPTGTDPKNKKKDKDKDKKFVWNHGITCPLKNTRKRRFRKTAKKKYIESPDVEKEVKRLLSTDADAVSVRYEIIAEDESKEADQHGSLGNLDSSPGTSGHKMGHGSSAQRDELREIFNDISSSSEDEEDEVDRHEDEDLNIMDTEDDLVRQLQEKLNESDSSNYTPGLSGINHHFCFSASTAGLPAGAAGLTDREVTTRGQPHVIFSHTYTHEEEEEEESLYISRPCQPSRSQEEDPGRRSRTAATLCTRGSSSSCELASSQFQVVS